MMESEDKNSEGKDDSQVKDLVFDFDNKLYISESELENKKYVQDLDNKLPMGRWYLCGLSGCWWNRRFQPVETLVPS